MSNLKANQEYTILFVFSQCTRFIYFLIHCRGNDLSASETNPVKITNRGYIHALKVREMLDAKVIKVWKVDSQTHLKKNNNNNQSEIETYHL